jgi:hypothetical protein
LWVRHCAGGVTPPAPFDDPLDSDTYYLINQASGKLDAAANVSARSDLGQLGDDEGAERQLDDQQRRHRPVP